MKEKIKFSNEKEGGDNCAVLEYSSKQGDKKKRRLKSIALLAFNVLVIAVIIVVEFTSNDQHVSIGTVLGTWGENWYFIVALLGLVVAYYLCLTIRISLLIRATTGRPRRKLSFSTAVLGKYYDNITPLGSGGQPFQMFNLGRKLDVGLATSIPTADFIIHQLVFVLLFFAAVIINALSPTPMIESNFIKVFAYIGVVFYAAIPLVVILFSIFPGGITAIAKFFCRIGHKLHLIKDLEKAEDKVISAVKKYTTSLKNVSKKKSYLLLSALISAVCWIAFHSLPYFVLRVCGVEGVDYLSTVVMSIFAYCAITFIPTPGNAGAAEGAFYIIFSSLTGGFLFWGTILWRFCNYYLPLLSGFSITIYQYAKATRKEKKAAVASASSGNGIASNDNNGDNNGDISGDNNGDNKGEPK